MSARPNAHSNWLEDFLSITEPCVSTPRPSPAATQTLDPHPAVTYLRALFEPTDFVCLTFIHGTKKYPDGSAVTTNEFKPLSAVTTEAGIKYLTKKNKEWNVYVSMAPFKSGSKNRTKANIAKACNVFIEADENGDAVLADVRDDVAANKIPAPTILVQSSPHKFHLIWNVVEFTVPEQEAMNRTLQQKFGTDPQATDAARVLRIPGFRNLKPKYGNPKPVVELVEYNEPPVSGITKFDFRIPMTSAPDNTVHPPASDAVVQQSMELLEAAMDEASVSYTRKPWEGSGGAHKFLLALCPWRESHTNGEPSDAMAFVQPSGAYGFKCLHAHCADKTWNQFRSHLESLAGHRLEFNKVKQPNPSHQDANPTAESVSEIAQLIFTLPAVPTTEANYCEYVLAAAVDPEKPADNNEAWFPRGAVSLVGAPSGAGKTTLMYQMLLTQQCHGTFLGHASFGLPFVVLGADRGKGANVRTMRRMRIQPGTLSFIGLATNFDLRAVQDVIHKLEALPVMPAVVLIEGVDMMVSKVNDIQCVRIFMDLLHTVAERYHIAIIGTLGSPKIKVGQGYTAKRDNMLGSSGWGRKCETYLNLQFPKSDDTDGRRLLFMLPRNGKSEKLTLEFNHGQLERIPDIVEDEIDTATTEIAWFQEQAALGKKNPTKQWWTALDMERALSLSRATAHRHIGDTLSKGYLKVKPGPKVGRGAAEQYQWNESETNPLWARATQDEQEVFL